MDLGRNEDSYFGGWKYLGHKPKMTLKFASICNKNKLSNWTLQSHPLMVLLGQWHEYRCWPRCSCWRPSRCPGWPPRPWMSRRGLRLSSTEIRPSLVRFRSVSDLRRCLSLKSHPNQWMLDEGICPRLRTHFLFFLALKRFGKTHCFRWSLCSPNWMLRPFWSLRWWRWPLRPEPSSSPLSCWRVSLHLQNILELLEIPELIIWPTTSGD